MNVSILVGKDAVILGKTSSDARISVRRCGKSLDRAALAAALCRLTGEADFVGRQDVEIAGEAGTSYGDLTAAMDTAIAVGLLDVGMVDPPSLSVKLPGTSAVAPVEPACDQVPAPCKPAAPPPARDPSIAQPVGISLPPAEQEAQLKRAPIVTIEGDKILLNGDPVAEVSALPAGEWKIIELFDAVRALPAGSLVIFQADPATDAEVVSKVMKTLYAAERPNIMFALPGRRPR